MSEKTNSKAPSTEVGVPAEGSKGGMWKGAMNTVSSFNPLGSKSDKKKPAPSEGKDSPKETKTPYFPAVKVGDAGAAAGSAVAGSFRGAVNCARMLNPMAYDSASDDAASEGDDRDPVDHPENAEQLRKKESALAVMLRKAKNKFVSKGLEGQVSIEILVGVVTSGEYCTIEKGDSLEEIDEDELEQLGALNFKAVSAMDAIIANLSRRSKQYAGKELRSGVTLTQGVSFGVGVPFLMSVGFATSIYFECTVDSLLTYQKRKEKLRAFQKKLKSIGNADAQIAEVMTKGYSMEIATRAVVETGGVGAADAQRWAAENDREFELADHVLAPGPCSPPHVGVS